MADVLGGVFGVYVDPTEILAVAIEAEILALVDVLAALIPDAGVAAIGTSGASEAKTDFDQIPPHTAVKIQAEIAAMRAAIVASPGT